MIISEKTKIIDLSFSADGFRLTGTLHLPGINQPPFVVGSHGLLSSANSPKQIELAGKCSENGIAFFRFDHRGCGKSEGSKTDAADFNGRCRDLSSAIEFLQNHYDLGSRMGLFGSSLGGAVCIATAASTNTSAIVTIAAPLNSRSLIMAARGIEPVEISAELALDQKFRFDISKSLSSMRNFLIFHGDKDSVVPVSHAYELFEKAGYPKKLIIQEEGDHVMSNPRDQKQFIHKTITWFTSCLKPL